MADCYFKFCIHIVSFCVVVDNAAMVDVGQDIIVREGVQVTINCTHLINNKTNSGVQNPTVTWTKDGVTLTNGSTTNGSAVNVAISNDDRLCIITSTLMTVGGQAGNDGIYTCEVCGGNTNCNSGMSSLIVCGKREYFNNYMHTYILFISYVCR